MRCPDDPNKVLVTPSGIYKKSLKPEQILCIDLHGKMLEESSLRPTSETPIHLAIMRSRPDVNAVVHDSRGVRHRLSVFPASIFSRSRPMPVMVGKLPIVEWTVTGSTESGEIIAAALAGHQNYVLIRNHGLFVCGASLQYAAGFTDMIESTCKGLVLCKMMGVNPKGAAPREGRDRPGIGKSASGLALNPL